VISCNRRCFNIVLLLYDLSGMHLLLVFIACVWPSLGRVSVSCVYVSRRKDWIGGINHPLEQTTFQGKGGRASEWSLLSLRYISSLLFLFSEALVNPFNSINFFLVIPNLVCIFLFILSIWLQIFQIRLCSIRMQIVIGWKSSMAEGRCHASNPSKPFHRSNFT